MEETTMEALIYDTVTRAVENALKEWKPRSGWQEINGKLTMTVQELAEQLNISEAAAYELTERDGFPILRVSERRKVIPVEGLMDWMRKQARGGE